MRANRRLAEAFLFYIIVDVNQWQKQKQKNKELYDVLKYVSHKKQNVCRSWSNDSLPHAAMIY